ncbi:ABC transporter substrate-binding protein [Pseudarthrobacter sp. J1738]|uniref:ABC transporter substrate-binding protein n=1 Tax=unclassified Pseudarthrobacter TaxID=2647000 RepID=UPI003D2D8252
MATTLAACTATPTPVPTESGSQATSANPTATFNFGTAAQPLGLDPALTSDAETYRVTRQILEGLLGVDQNTGKPSALLATEWSEADNGLSYSFTLRQNVKFQDGTDFNAAAVCSNFERWYHFPQSLRKSHTGISFGTVFKAFSDKPAASTYKGCTVKDSNHLSITLNQRFTGFLQALTTPAFAISSPTALAAGKADQPVKATDGTSYSVYARQPVGTGPYTLKKWTSTEVNLSINEDYWGDKGQIGTLNFITYDRSEARLAALESGTIDGYDLVTVDNFQQLVKEGKQIVQRDPFSVMYLGINEAVEPLGNYKVREAIEYAIDKDTLIRKFFIDGTAKASQFVPAKLSGFNSSATSLGYDPEKAKTALKVSGYKNQEIKFYYPLNVTRAYLPTPEKIYAEIARQLTAVGFNIKPVPVEWSDGYVQKVTSPGDHGLHLLGWNGAYSDPDNFVAPLFGETNGEFGYPGPQVFSKIARARGISDGTERQDAYTSINQQLADDIPAVPIAYPISALAMSNRVLSYPASPVLYEVFTQVKLTQ